MGAFRYATAIHLLVDGQLFTDPGGCRADGAMNPAILRIIIMDVYKQLAPQDKDYFRASRERRFGKPLEQVTTESLRRCTDLTTPARPACKFSGYNGSFQPGLCSGTVVMS